MEMVEIALAERGANGVNSHSEWRCKWGREWKVSHNGRGLLGKDAAAEYENM